MIDYIFVTQSLRVLFIWVLYLFICFFAFSALTLLVGHQEEHLPLKN